MDWNGADAQQKEPFHNNIYFVKFLFEQFKLEKKSTYYSDQGSGYSYIFY